MEYKEVKLRPVVKAGGWIFIIWGIVVVVKGILDAFIFEPETEFIALKEWIRYAGFEIVYGFACILFGLVIFEFSKRVKEKIKKRIENSIEL